MDLLRVSFFLLIDDYIAVTLPCNFLSSPKRHKSFSDKFLLEMEPRRAIDTKKSHRHSHTATMNYQQKATTTTATANIYDYD